MTWWKQMFHAECEPTMLRRDHEQVVRLLLDQLADARADRTALREMLESLTFATVAQANAGKTSERLVRREPDAVKTAILEKAGGDMKLARYLGEWVRQERAKSDRRPDDELIGDILNWAAVDDSSDDAMTS